MCNRMRGLGGIVQSLGALLASAGVHLPPWGVPVVVLAVVIALLPRIVATMETSRIRRMVQRSRGAADIERVELEQEALQLAGDDPNRLIAVADEALRARRPPLAQEAVDRLAAGTSALKPPLKRELKRLRKELKPKDPMPADPVAAALVVERLIEAGLLDEARRRHARFVREWPADAELQRIGAALTAA